MVQWTKKLASHLGLQGLSRFLCALVVVSVWGCSVVKAGPAPPVGLAVAAGVCQDIFAALVESLQGGEVRISELERQLVEARSRAQRAKTLADEAAAVVAHELRNDLGAIWAYARQACENGGRAQVSEDVRQIEKLAERLLGDLNTTLAIAKMAAGKGNVEPIDQAFDPSQYVRDVIHVAQMKTRGLELSLDFELRATIPEHIESDSHVLRHILMNLINNAVKFTDPGGSVKLVMEVSADGKQILFHVEDTGKGMDAATLERIFEKFESVGEDVHGRVEGTGMGLPLAKDLAQALGGEISAKSEPGKGSTFTVAIPLKVVKAPPVAARPEGSARANSVAASDTAKVTPVIRLQNGEELALSEATVLVVEDSLVNQKLMEGLLKKEGARVIIAENGVEALRLMDEGASPDLILMDHQMPEMDGPQAAAALRAGGFTGRIVGATAHEDGGDWGRERIDGFVTKPYSLESLFDTLSHLGEER